MAKKKKAISKKLQKKMTKTSMPTKCQVRMAKKKKGNVKQTPLVTKKVNAPGAY